MTNETHTHLILTFVMEGNGKSFKLLPIPAQNPEEIYYFQIFDRLCRELADNFSNTRKGMLEVSQPRSERQPHGKSLSFPGDVVYMSKYTHVTLGMWWEIREYNY